MTNEKEQTNWIMKVNIPMDDVFFFQDWKGSCKAKSPLGFDDYYWGKIKHDHFFTKSFEPILRDILTELQMLRAEVHRQNVEEIPKEEDDLFKK